jgi:serine/threonine-protein kinase
LIEGGDVCEATDLYAVGAILFEALTGRPPFPGDNPVLVRFAQVQASPPVPSHLVTTAIPAELDAVIVRALAKDPARRYADAQTMAAALVAVKTPTAADRTIGQTMTAGVLPPPRIAVERAAPAVRPVDPVGTVRVTRSVGARQASGGWAWPIGIACVAVLVLIAALAANLSGNPPADEAAAGVSVDAKDSGQPAMTTLARPALTPTARVLRTSDPGGAVVPTGNAFRAASGPSSKTPPPMTTSTPIG